LEEVRKGGKNIRNTDERRLIGKEQDRWTVAEKKRKTRVCGCDKPLSLFLLKMQTREPFSVTLPGGRN
jgi:hypothetical protein